MRVNEPFGEVVNWDLLPMNAIQRIDLMPGSNPLFGLNTLGGALAISTKSGFSNPSVEAQVAGGTQKPTQRAQRSAENAEKPRPDEQT